jgi:hypothetical protein
MMKISLQIHEALLSILSCQAECSFTSLPWMDIMWDQDLIAHIVSHQTVQQVTKGLLCIFC